MELKTDFVKKNSMSNAAFLQTLQTLDISRAAARVAPELLKALSVLSATTVRGSAVD